MARINEHYLKLKAGYLFPEIGRRVKAFAEATPSAKIIRLGIGDVTRPLSPAVLKAFHDAISELGEENTFRGYGPEQGYGFLIDTLIEKVYAPLGVRLKASEIFISDGSKCDCANILDIFSLENRVAIADPVYPVYNDTNVMIGRSGPSDEKGYYEGIIYLPCLEENGFLPRLPKEKADIIYLCFPNNPTGMVASRDQLKEWVDYALANNSLILFDAAYEAFVSEPGYPRSIYEISGASKCAIEFRSFSKTAGFTGVRCAFAVVPEGVFAKTPSGQAEPLNLLWNRRQTTKFNGVSYIVQRGAEAVFSAEGQGQIRSDIAYYLENAEIISRTLTELGIWFTGGKNAPYIWLKCPNDMLSWDFFDLLLDKAGLVGTPGAGFGERGEGFFRLSAFGKRENVIKGAEKIKTLEVEPLK